MTENYCTEVFSIRKKFFICGYRRTRARKTPAGMHLENRLGTMIFVFVMTMITVLVMTMITVCVMNTYGTAPNVRKNETGVCVERERARARTSE